MDKSHPVSEPNSSKAYRPALTQGPKSQIFSSFFNGVGRQPELMKLTNYRDEFYHNHISVTADGAKKFVIDCTSKATKQEEGRAIACALLTLRDQDFFPLFFDFVFLNQKSHDFGLIIDQIWITILETVRKSYLFFSPNAFNNTLRILDFASEKNLNYLKLCDLSSFLISSIDTGCIIQTNINLIEFFIGHTQKFQQLWQKFDNVTVHLIIKFLRFYQDSFLIKEEIPDRSKAPSQTTTVPLRSASASTSSIPVLNDSSARISMSMLQKILTLAKNYENFFPIFFNIGITANLIAKCAFKEIERILYDSRTFQTMSNKFPSIYKSFLAILEKNIFCFTNNQILQVMLPYPHLKEMLAYNNSFNQKSDLDYPPFLRRNSKLVDYDLILSDSIRTYLQSIDYNNTPIEHRTGFINNIFHKAIEKGVKLHSSLHALIGDFFFIPSDLNENTESQKRVFHLVSPAIFIIEDPKMEKFASLLIETILSKLKQSDFITTKINSFRNLLRYLSEKKRINILDRVMTFKYLNDKQKEEFKNFASINESNVVPQKIVEFSKQNLPLDSNDGIAAIQAANEQILSFYAQNGNNWEIIIPNVKRIFDALVRSSRKGIETVMNIIDIHAITPCMCSTLFDAQTVLKFVNDQKLFEEFDEALQYTDINLYCDALVHEISSYVHHSRYRQFLTICKSFRKNLKVLKTICDCCQMSLVSELADLPYLDVGHDNLINFIARIFTICNSWSNDSLSKLTVLLGGIIITPLDLDDISVPLLDSFENLPQIIVLFFQNMMMFRVDPIYSQIMSKLQQKKTQKAIEFCKAIMIRWNSKKSLNPQVSRPMLVPDIML